MTTKSAARSGRDGELSAIPLVWMYHSVADYDEDPYEVTMTPERFEKQMRWLKHRGLRGVSMSELLSAVADGRSRGLVGLTFDDGYQDFVENAMPLLKRHGFNATVFVLAGRLGGTNEWSSPGPVKPLLSADQIRSICDSGIEIGSHGLRHISLVKATDAQLAREVEFSREILQQLLGRSVPGFCYPYGYLDTRVVDAVRSAGYDYACAVSPSASIGRLAIPRTLVHDRDSAWRLDAKRAVWALAVGNRVGVSRYRGGRP